MKIHRSAYLIILVTCIALTGACKKNKHWELSRFVSPETCGGCHDVIYEQWKGSMHNLAHHDPLYREVAIHDLKGLTDPDEIKEAEHCVVCHTPVGYVSGMPKKTSDHLKKVPGLAAQGIQCDYCHSATKVRKIYNAEIDIEPGNGESDPGTKRGPRKDVEPEYHAAAYSAMHTRSEFCGACHDVRHVVFGTRLETPYEEWKEGPYAEKGIQCQECHMRQRPGVPSTGSTERPDTPGALAAGAKERPHVFTHYFAGGNTLIPSLFGNSEQSKLAGERLRHAATLSVDGALSDGLLRVTVTNSGAGHRIPTGLSHVRQMWLEITVAGAGGRKLFRSGALDPQGRIMPGAIMYNTVFGDGSGKPVMNVAKAREILGDNRIAPLASEVASYRLPEISEAFVTVEAKLWYRIVSQELVDSVLGKGKLAIPSVLMASDKKTVKVR